MLQKHPDRTVLVTGGAGFIGSHLVDHLLLRDEYTSWHVVVVDNFDPSSYPAATKRANIARHMSNPRFTLHETDIRRKEDLAKVFAAHDVDVVVHLASRAGVRPSLADPAAYIETNVTGTLHVLDCARDAGVPQVVFGSSSSVYGAAPRVPSRETDAAAAPVSPYAASKAAGELLCHTYAHLYDLRCVCLRFFTVYGARQRPDLAVHKFARLIREGRPVPVFGDGSASRDYTHVDDIVRGVRAAMDYRGGEGYEVFNLGGSQAVELRTLVGRLEEALGREAVVQRLGMQPGDVPATCADTSKARDVLGYEPRTRIGEGIPMFVEWFLEQEKGEDGG